MARVAAANVRGRVLRTPLTGVRLRLEGLSDRFGQERAVKAEAEAAMREIDRLSAIVDELLILSRAGERELPGEAVDLRAAARRAAERWRAAAAERGIEIAVEASREASAWCAGADPERSIDVLLENAILYSPPGSAVTVAAAPGRIEVRDEGPGLTAGEEEVVFERFSRGRAGQRGPSGTGLGLPIARELSRQWGGDVTLANREQGGFRAVIRLTV